MEQVSRAVNITNILRLMGFLRNKIARPFFFFFFFCFFVFFFFAECSLLSTVSKNTIKKIGHHARKKDLMGQTYLIYACSCTNRARYFICPHYILR